MQLLTPPILDIFVVWHPDDLSGAARFRELQAHFHSQTFSGLAGGAVEVYARSAPWEGDVPRPLEVASAPASGLPRAQFNAVVPILGAHLARAVGEASSSWATYIEEIAALDQIEGGGVFPLRVAGFDLPGTRLADLIGKPQTLPPSAWGDGDVFARELCQSITQRIQRLDGVEPRVRVFVSHTKHPSLVEDSEHDGAWIYEKVREEIGRTRLDEFFDAQDIQTGADWEAELETSAAESALLMVRTDSYAGREWTQREVFAAKRAGMPVVCMYALTSGEERGSFLMDHVPSVPCDLDDPLPGIKAALSRLVDEALKRALWQAQTRYVSEGGFDWAPVHSPEPVTLVPWLARHRTENPDDPHVWIIHPDPPLGPRERQVVRELCELAGFSEQVDVLTPRTFALRGGVMGK